MRGSTNLGVIVTASLAGLLFGFDTVVISGVTESVGRVFHLDAGSFWYGFSVASALLGTFIGALVAGVPGDRYGSRDTLKAVGFMYVASALGCAFWSVMISVRRSASSSFVSIVPSSALISLC